ncbi:hypothetical protein ACJX0J_030242, partial [Zea mays]
MALSAKEKNHPTFNFFFFLPAGAQLFMATWKLGASIEAVNTLFRRQSGIYVTIVSRLASTRAVAIDDLEYPTVFGYLFIIHYSVILCEFYKTIFKTG